MLLIHQKFLLVEVTFHEEMSPNVMEKQKQEGPRHTFRKNVTQPSRRQLKLSIMNSKWRLNKIRLIKVHKTRREFQKNK